MNIINEEVLSSMIQKQLQSIINEQLKQPVWWTLEDLITNERVGGETVVKDMLNYPPYKGELQNDIVHYPEAKRQPYIIHAQRMKEWLDKNFRKINSEKKLWRVTK